MTEDKKIFASPKVRKFARELGANVSLVEGTERKGRITEEDVKKFISNQLKVPKNTKEDSQPLDKIKNEYNHSDFGEVEIKEVPRVKRIAAPHLVNSWKNIPHVTHHDEADITEMEEFRSSLTDSFTGEKKKITPLAFIIKALVSSLIKFPTFNSSIEDIDKGKMTIKKYYHIGIAVDTPHGLMVPKLRNANNKNISLVSKELKEISDKCRNLKIDKKEINDEKIFDLAIDSGANECISHEEYHEIHTNVDEIYDVKKKLEKNISNFISTEIEWIPINLINITGEDKDKMIKFMEMVDDNDDVQNIFTNAKFEN